MLERHLRGELFRSVSELRVFQGGGRIRAWTHTAVGGGNLCRDQSAPRRDTVGKKPRRIALELLTLGACKTSVNWFLGANYFSERNFEKLKGGFPAGNGAPPPADPSWHPQSAAPLWGGRGGWEAGPRTHCSACETVPVVLPHCVERAFQRACMAHWWA